MLDILLWIAVGLWAVMLLQALVNRALAPDLRSVEVDDPDDWPLVSMVVPARDEEAGIERAVTSFCTQDYPNLEVIVVDDGSTDRTSEILAQMERRYDTLRVVQGSEPPAGWMGKVYALEIGRRRAAGEWLLFVDADVTYDSLLVRRAVAYALREGLDMLVLAPIFRSGGALEASIVSGLYLVAVAMTPLFLVSRTRSPWLSAGGGVFNMVSRRALDAAGAFATIKGKVVDDVALGIQVKRTGGKVVPAWAGPWVQVRMYDGVQATMRGFTKNIYSGLAAVGPLMLLFPFTVGSLISFVPYVGLAAGLAGATAILPAIVSLLLMHVTLGLIAVTFRQPWAIVFLTPVRELLWWVIVVRSFLQYRRHGVTWRGRSYPNHP